jgi:hypothetical protein
MIEKGKTTITSQKRPVIMNSLSTNGARDIIDMSEFINNNPYAQPVWYPDYNNDLQTTPPVVISPSFDFEEYLKMRSRPPVQYNTPDQSTTGMFGKLKSVMTKMKKKLKKK